MTIYMRLLGWILLTTGSALSNAQPLSDKEAEMFSRMIPPNSCVIRCPEDVSYAPNVGFQVCGEESTPICHCAGSESRMANCESDENSVRTSNPDAARFIYNDENAPEYYRFKLLLDRLDGPIPVDAGEFDTYLKSLQNEIEEELARLERRIRCPSQRPRATGMDVAHLYTAADDAQEAIYRKYFAIATAELGFESFARLQRLYMDHGGFTSVFTNHWSRDVTKLEQNLKRICDNVDSLAP